MLNRRHVLAGLSAAAVAGTKGVAFAQAKPPIKIGALLPMTGFGASYGTLFQTAVKMGVDDVNKAGGINGSPIELLIEDDQFQATQSVLLFRRLAGENAAAVVGPISGTGWENVAPIANSMKVPALNYSALKPGISMKPYALRIHPSDDTLIPEAVAEFAKLFPNAKKIVVAGDMQEASAAAGVELFASTAAKLGMQVLDKLTYQSKTTDFSPLVIKMRSLEPDAVFISSHVPTSLPLLKEMEAQGIKKPVLASALVWGGTNFVLAIGSAGDNLYCVGFNTNEPSETNPLQKSFTERYLQATLNTNLQQPANVGNVTVAYDAISLIADILKRSGVDGTKSIDAIRQVLMTELNKMKDWNGINALHMRDTGDGHIQGHVLKADVPNKRWVYALPVSQRAPG
jgi:branched-chain amino acid transport system substrate-binding protein